MITAFRWLPLRQQLYALQILEYQATRYLRWWLAHATYFQIERKKSLTWTSKARFLFTTALLLHLTITLLILSKITGVTSVTNVTIVTNVTLFLALFPAPLLLLSLLILKPYEVFNRRRAIKQVQNLLQSLPRLKIIGITGSYGKTSVKDILAQTLSLKYKVLATPQSYNTLFGIANFVREKLKAEHEILIVEMGAYQRGEIRELCQMVPPRIGVITGLTNQHLERFGSLENIAAAKYELIETLPKDGLAVFNLDSPDLAPLYQKTKITKIGYSREKAADLYTEDIKATPTNSEFDLLTKSDQSLPMRPIRLTTNLPGTHQISNALAAVAVALSLGLTPEQIRKGLSQVRPPAHRLQLLPQPNGTLIIDDAYSSNPEGVKAAVNLITQLPHHPKIIVTPGMVELGSRQVEENVNFGKLIAAHFDYAVIVNKTNRKALLSGLNEGGWGPLPAMKQSNNVTMKKNNGAAKQKIFITDTLDEATKNLLPRLAQPSCLVLFENDLPDTYL